MKPNRTQTIIAAILIFLAFAAGGLMMELVSPAVGQAQQGILQTLGAALFGSGLTFLLMQAFSWEKDRTPSKGSGAGNRAA